MVFRANLSESLNKSILTKTTTADEEYERTVSAKIYLNLELLIRINDILETILEMGKLRAFEAVFNKATQWWDETLKLQDCFLAFYQVLGRSTK